MAKSQFLCKGLDMASVKMYKFQSKKVSAILKILRKKMFEIIYCHFKLCYLVNILYIHLVKWNNVEEIKYQRSTQR